MPKRSKKTAVPKKPETPLIIPPGATIESLYASLSLGQSLVIEFMGASAKANFDDSKAAKERLSAAFTNLMKWSLHRDDISKKPHPLELAGQFARYNDARFRDPVIKFLKETIEALEAQRPRPEDLPPLDEPSNLDVETISEDYRQLKEEEKANAEARSS